MDITALSSNLPTPPIVHTMVPEGRIANKFNGTSNIPESKSLKLDKLTFKDYLKTSAAGLIEIVAPNQIKKDSAIVKKNFANQVVKNGQNLFGNIYDGGSKRIDKYLYLVILLIGISICLFYRTKKKYKKKYKYINLILFILFSIFIYGSITS